MWDVLSSSCNVVVPSSPLWFYLLCVHDESGHRLQALRSAVQERLSALRSATTHGPHTQASYNRLLMGLLNDKLIITIKSINISTSLAINVSILFYLQWVYIRRTPHIVFEKKTSPYLSIFNLFYWQFGSLWRYMTYFWLPWQHNNLKQITLWKRP